MLNFQVLIGQEKMATNTVYVFGMKDHKYSYKTEIRSMLENSSRPTSTLYVNMLARGSASGVQNARKSSECIVAILPYIKEEIPIIVVFRALGFESDRDILEHIVYDFEDQDMMLKIAPSLDEAFVIQDRNVALSFIGKLETCMLAKQKCQGWPFRYSFTAVDFKFKI